KRFENFLEKRKLDIVTAVLKLVDRVGVAGVTTKRIAHEVGFVEGALYKHFNSKNEIFHRLLEISEVQLSDSFREMDARDLGPEQKLREWFQFVIAYLEDFPGIYRILFSDDLYNEDKELFKKFKSIAWDLKERLEKIIRLGKKRMIFKPDVNCEMSAIIYLGMIHTSFTLWNVFEERSKSLRDISRPLFAEFMKSLLLEEVVR
ncbi:MAG: TetR/AcrR family transcriptional regulator, partial [Candidatus Aminicenantes bacterium]|nr:TetR/AcrR family transcriptional regulator [Candidatus Aminicenantes bacterium]